MIMYKLTRTDFRFAIFHNGKELSLVKAIRLTERVMRTRGVLSIPSEVQPERSLFDFMCKNLRLSWPEWVDYITFDSGCKHVAVHYKPLQQLKKCLPLT